jgi:hypothetical protein
MNGAKGPWAIVEGPWDWDPETERVIPPLPGAAMAIVAVRETRRCATPEEFDARMRGNRPWGDRPWLSVGWGHSTTAWMEGHPGSAWCRSVRAIVRWRWSEVWVVRLPERTEDLAAFARELPDGMLDLRPGEVGELPTINVWERE